MKHLALVCLIAILSTAFFSCNKNSTTEPKVTSTKVDLTKIENDLRLINSRHASHVADKTTQAAQSSGKGWVVAGADLIGAATTGKTVCPGLAEFGFLGIGAGLLLTGIGGALASYGAYKSYSVVAPSGGSTSGQKGRIVNNVGTYSVPNPYNNPCENAGISHNQFVKILCQKKEDLALNPTTLAFAQSDLTDDELTMISDDKNQYVYNLGMFVNDPKNLVDASGNVSLMPLIHYSFANDPEMEGIITELINGLSQTGDLASGLSLMNDYENYFISNPEYLDTWQQYSILSGLSVGKYSLTMWTDAYSAN